MTYLTSYRSASGKYGIDKGKAFKLPEPYKPRTKPVGANDNSPAPANDNNRPLRRAAKLLALARKGSRLARLNPYVQAALLAWDLWDLQNPTTSGENQALVLDPTLAAGSPWTVNRTCPGNGPGPIWGWYGSTGSPGASTFTCAGLQAITPKRLNEPQNWDFWTYVVPDVPNPSNTWGYYYRNTTTYKRPSALNTSFTPATWHPMSPRPAMWGSLSPWLLPIQHVMPLPLPMPLALVPHRLDDPLGSQRNNGDRRPRFVRRAKPPRGKEKKLGVFGPIFFALQKAHHATTEGLDALDAVHDALPKELQAKARFHDGRWWKASPQDKARAVWHNMDKLDWNEAVTNLVVNHLVDEVVGRAAGTAKRGLDRGGAGGTRIIGGGAIFNPLGG